MPSTIAPKSARKISRGPRAALPHPAATASGSRPWPGALRNLLIGLAIGTLAIWMLRQAWAKSQFWPWLILLFAAFFVAHIVSLNGAWMRTVMVPSSTAPDASRQRRLGGMICVGAALALTLLLILVLAADRQHWQGTPVIWLMAIGILLAGVALIGPVGASSPRAETASRPWMDNRLHRWMEVGAFVAIMALAIFLRLYRIHEIPSGIYVDETNAGVDALYILEGRAASPFGTGWYGTPNGYIYYMALLFKVLGANWMALKWASLIPAILTVPAVYLLGREMFGPLQGLTAMFLIAVSRWHLSMSRWGWNETAPPLFQVLGMYFLLRALRGRRALDYALSGLIMGLSLYTYVGARLAVLTWALFILYWFLSDPEGIAACLRRSWRGMLILAIAALVVSAPVLLNYALDPFGFGNRVAEISVMRDIQSQGSLQPLWLNITGIFKFFHQTGDLQGKHNLPGEPMMDPVTGLFFAIGVAYALIRLRDQRRVLLLLWLVIGLAGSFLSAHHESPQAYRSLTALPAGILLAADALALSTLALQGSLGSRTAPVRASRARSPRALTGAARWLPAAFIVIALAAAGIWEAYVYFNIQARSMAVIRGFNATENGVARETIAALQSGTSVYLSPGMAQFSPLRFLVYGVYKARNGLNTLDDPPYNTILPATGLPLPADSGETLMLLESQYWPLREYVQAFYPHARTELVQLSDGSPQYVRITVPADDVAALLGLSVSTSYADGRMVVNRTASLVAPTDSSATRVEWDGDVRLEHSGRYEFETGPGWQVQIDDSAFAGEGFLGQGLYRIRVIWSPEIGAARELRWRVNAGDWQSVPPSLLFDVPAELNGLMATYWTNTSWDGQPLFRQITPFVLLSWGEGMLPTTAFSARFAGTLHISESGMYDFEVDADDGARLLIDGKVLGEGLVPNQPNRFNASIDLGPGDHPLQLDYVQFGGGSGLRLLWRHGDKPFEPVPPSALIPQSP